MTDDSRDPAAAAGGFLGRPTGRRVRDMVRPWWRLPMFWSVLVLFTATANRYAIDRGRSFPAELGASAALATVVVLILLAQNVFLDRRDRRRGR